MAGMTITAPPTLLHVVASLVDVLDIDDRDALTTYLTTRPIPLELEQDRGPVLYAAAHDLDELAADDTDRTPAARCPRLALMPDSPTAAPLTDPDSLSRVSAQVAALTDGIAGLGLTLPAADPLVIAGAQHQALHVVYLLGSLDVDPDPDTETAARRDLAQHPYPATGVLDLLAAALEALTAREDFHDSAALAEAALTLREIHTDLNALQDLDDLRAPR